MQECLPKKIKDHLHSKHPTNHLLTSLPEASNFAGKNYATSYIQARCLTNASTYSAIWAIKFNTKRVLSTGWYSVVCFSVLVEKASPIRIPAKPAGIYSAWDKQGQFIPGEHPITQRHWNQPSGRMITLGAQNNYLFYLPPTDMRKGFDALSGLVLSSGMGRPTDGNVYVFVNRRRDKIKMLVWDRTGFALYYKRLERGTIELPAMQDGVQSGRLPWSVLVMMLEGVSLVNVKHRVRYRQVECWKISWLKPRTMGNLQLILCPTTRHYTSNSVCMTAWLTQNGEFLVMSLRLVFFR